MQGVNTVATDLWKNGAFLKLQKISFILNEHKQEKCRVSLIVLQIENGFKHFFEYLILSMNLYLFISNIRYVL